MLLRWIEARTQEDVEKAIAAALATIVGPVACGWFRHCMYTLNRQAL